MPQILLSNHSFNYEVERKSITSFRLRLKSKNTFVVSCHYLTPNFIVTKFIRDHQEWILKNSPKVVHQKSLKTIKNLQILDEKYELIIKKMPRDSVVIFKNEHQIYVNTTSLASAHLKKLLDTKFRPLALSLITQEIQRLASLHHFKYRRISVKNTTSRFGSCSSTNNLNFNWQIILLPVNIFRHIILHELTHTIHHNHSLKFWNQLAVYDPSWRIHRQYLRTSASRHFIV